VSYVKSMSSIRVTNKSLKKLAVIFLAAVIIFLICILASHNTKKQKNVVFTVQGISYSRQYVSSLISYPLSVRGYSARESLTEQAFSYLKSKQVAEDLNIQPTNGEIVLAKDQSYFPNETSQDKSSKWTELVSYNQALQQELRSNSPSIYQGYSFVFWFGHYLETGPVYTTPNYGNPQLIAQDRAYAQGRANYYYQQLKSGKVSAAAALSAVQNDPKLSFVFPTSTISLSVHFGFDSSEGWQNQVEYTDIMNYINSQSKPGLSQLLTGKIDSKNDPSKSVDAYYYFVKLTYAKKIPANISTQFSSKLASLKTNYRGW
jgi:hypothetical protein